MFEVTVDPARESLVSSPELVFEGDHPHLDSVTSRGFDYSERQKAFLFLRPSGHQTQSLTVTVDWFRELERLSPIAYR